MKKYDYFFFFGIVLIISSSLAIVLSYGPVAMMIVIGAGLVLIVIALHIENRLLSKFEVGA